MRRGFLAMDEHHWRTQLYNNSFFNGRSKGISISFWLQNLHMFGTLNILLILGLGSIIRQPDNGANVGDYLSEPGVISQVLSVLEERQNFAEAVLEFTDDGDIRLLHTHVQIMLYDRWRRIFQTEERCHYIQAMNTAGHSGTPLWDATMENDLPAQMQRAEQEVLIEENLQGYRSMFDRREGISARISESGNNQNSGSNIYADIDGEVFVPFSQSAPPSVCCPDSGNAPLCGICREHKKERSFASLPCCSRVGGSNKIHVVCLAECAVKSTRRVGAGNLECPFCREIIQIRATNRQLDERDISEEISLDTHEFSFLNADTPCTSAQVRQSRGASANHYSNPIDFSPTTNIQASSIMPNEPHLSDWDPAHFLATVPCSTTQAVDRDSRGFISNWLSREDISMHDETARSQDDGDIDDFPDGFPLNEEDDLDG